MKREIFEKPIGRDLWRRGQSLGDAQDQEEARSEAKKL
jgi:hypothetical protein